MRKKLDVRHVSFRVMIFFPVVQKRLLIQFILLLIHDIGIVG